MFSVQTPPTLVLLERSLRRPASTVCILIQTPGRARHLHTCWVLGKSGTTAADRPHALGRCRWAPSAPLARVGRPGCPGRLVRWSLDYFYLVYFATLKRDRLHVLDLSECRPTRQPVKKLTGCT